MKSSPRVLHIVPALFDSNDGVLGGAERYSFELARHMAEEVPTSLVSFGEEGRQQWVDCLRVRVIGNPWYVGGLRSNPLALALFDEVRKADIVHCHQQHILASSLTALFCRMLGRRVFVSDLGGGGWDISAYVCTDRWYNGHLHISEYSRNISRHSGKPWAHVIMGGVDVEKFSPDESVQRDGTVLFVGRLLPHKGVNDLIDAITPQIRLEVIGWHFDVRYLEDLRIRARGKQVIFRHDCDDRALIDAYRRAMCVVLPSVYRDMYGGETKVPELLGQVLLEGMACGAPVICTDVGSLPEIVEDGVTGFIIPPNDPQSLRCRLEWLQRHPEAAREMGRAARRRVEEKFTWPSVVRRCLEIYTART
jgi:glycosyltransferase involved in cell wall biosynthesis